MSSIFKVTFNKSSFDLADSYERLSDLDKERISDLNAVAFFDFDYDDKYLFYIILDSMQMNSYSNILKENLIPHRIQDISSDVVNCNIDLEKSISEFVCPMNSIKWSFFVEDLNKWILQNLDIDIVLDRISTVGIDSLRVVEKDFLNKYSSVKTTN